MLFYFDLLGRSQQWR